MKKLITIIIAVCFMFAVAGPAFAQYKGEQKGYPNQKEEQMGAGKDKAKTKDLGKDKVDKKKCFNPQGKEIPCPQNDDNDSSKGKGKKYK